MLLLKLGWRNLWRSPRRSLITIAAVACAFFFLILLINMAEGMKEQMLRNATRLMTGHLQLHHPDYLPDRGLYDTLGGRDGVDPDLDAQLAQRPHIEAAAARAYGFALLSTGDDSAGAQLLGVRPARESRVTTFLESRVRGDGLGDSQPGGLLLGEALAKDLDADLGAQVAALTQAADGSLGNTLFTVTGILRTGLSHVDRSLAVVRLEDLQQLLALPERRYHEIALRVADPMQAQAVADRLNQSGDALPGGVEAHSWGDLSPQLRDYLGLYEASYGFLVGLIALFAALGILNTMLMAVFERTREIGMVSSLGMLPHQVLLTILAESFFLSLLGLAVGLGLGYWAMQPLSSSGLDLSRWMGELEVIGARMDPVIIFQWQWRMVANSAGALLIAGLLAAAVPAVRAARMNPVEALAGDRGA